MWDAGAGPVYPAEVRVGNDPVSRPFVTGGYGRTLPELHVSIAHRGETAVAMARAEGPCGIDIEEVTDRPEGTLAVALTTAERELLTSLVHRPGEPPNGSGSPVSGPPRRPSRRRAAPDWAASRSGSRSPRSTATG